MNRTFCCIVLNVRFVPKATESLRRREMTQRASSGLMRYNKSGRFRNWLSGVQLVEQRLRLLQIARIEPLRKPPVNRSEQFASLLLLALVTPEARKAHGGAEFPGFGLLLTRNGQGALKIILSFGRISVLATSI
jgi:hypothetical protein